MPSGEAFTDTQVREIAAPARRRARRAGCTTPSTSAPVDGDIRDHAERLHAALGARAANGVLLLVAPGDRQLEIVTGKESSRRLSDRSCALAALSMTTSFSGGDLVGGIVTGVRMLAESAGRELHRSGLSPSRSRARLSTGRRRLGAQGAGHHVAVLDDEPAQRRRRLLRAQVLVGRCRRPTARPAGAGRGRPRPARPSRAYAGPTAGR